MISSELDKIRDEYAEKHCYERYYDCGPAHMYIAIFMAYAAGSEAGNDSAVMGQAVQTSGGDKRDSVDQARIDAHVYISGTESYQRDAKTART